MPKVPQKIPPWLATFVTFAKTKEKKTQTHQSLDLFLQVLTNHWEAFTEQNEKEKEENPPKPRNIDPIKSLGKAMEKVAERVAEAEGNEPLLKQYIDRVKQVVPEEMKTVLSEVSGVTNNHREEKSFSSENSSHLLSLVEKASQGMVELAAQTQTITENADKISPADFQKQMESANQLVLQNTTIIGQIKDQLSSE
jgi:hypothetical protein